MSAFFLSVKPSTDEAGGFPRLRKITGKCNNTDLFGHNNNHLLSKINKHANEYTAEIDRFKCCNRADDSQPETDH